MPAISLCIMLSSCSDFLVETPQTEVDAESVAEAFEAAKDAFMDADLKDMEVVDSHPVNCSDEDGNLLEDYNG